jgi:hypothetical protein
LLGIDIEMSVKKALEVKTYTLNKRKLKGRKKRRSRDAPKEDSSGCDSEAQYLSNEQVWFMLKAMEDEDSSS